MTTLVFEKIQEFTSRTSRPEHFSVLLNAVCVTGRDADGQEGSWWSLFLPPCYLESWYISKNIFEEFTKTSHCVYIYIGSRLKVRERIKSILVEFLKLNSCWCRWGAGVDAQNQWRWCKQPICIMPQWRAQSCSRHTSRKSIVHCPSLSRLWHIIVAELHLHGSKESLPRATLLCFVGD